MPFETFHNLPQDKREAIIRIALEEFATQPYNDASVKAIAAKAGVAKGSMYQYFQDKRDLYLYLIELSVTARLEFTSRRKIDWSDFYSSFRESMLCAAEFTLQHPYYNRLVEKAMDSPLREDALALTRQMSHDHLQPIVEEAQQRGIIRSDIPVDLVVSFFNILANEFIQVLARRAGIDQMDLHQIENVHKLGSLNAATISDQILDLIKNGTLERSDEQ